MDNQSSIMPPTAAQRRIHALLGVTSLLAEGEENGCWSFSNHIFFNRHFNCFHFISLISMQAREEG